MAPFGQCAFGTAVTTLFHPIAYAKVLIQVGHEPLAPEASVSWFGGKSTLYYPNVFRYIGHIKKTDGFFGLYRGLVPRLMSTYVNGLVSAAVADELTKSCPAIEADGNEAAKKLIVNTVNESIAKCAGVILSQPFHVIVVRSMCQFVGRETKYNSIWSSVVEIYHHDGIMGFFSGLMPRLIGELLTIWLVNIITHVCVSYLPAGDNQCPQDVRRLVPVITPMVVTQVMYPFNIVSNVMAVNNSGLAAGSPPNTEIFSSWTVCWSRLSSQKQLKRGANMFWRVCRSVDKSVPVLVPAHSG